AAALRAVRTRVGMVFQSFHLFPHLSVLGNVMEAPRRVLGLASPAAETRARALLERVGLAGYADAFPSTLSGGQQQRGARHRALASLGARRPTPRRALLCPRPAPGRRGAGRDRRSGGGGSDDGDRDPRALLRAAGGPSLGRAGRWADRGERAAGGGPRPSA